MKRGKPRGGFWTDAGGRRHQALGGRSFMGAEKTTFMIIEDRPKGRAPIHPHARVQKHVCTLCNGEPKVSYWVNVRFKEDEKDNKDSQNPINVCVPEKSDTLNSKKETVLPVLSVPGVRRTGWGQEDDGGALYW